MKKIFTLVLGLMLTVAMFAADRKPTVTVVKSRKYEIVIDGKRYLTSERTSNISNLSYGLHNVKVYQMKPGFFFTSRRLVSSSTFQLRNSDVKINIDRNGQLKISKLRSGRDWNDHDYSRGNRHVQKHNGKRF